MKLVTTLLSIIVSYYLAVLLHEWGHETVAWIFGYIPNVIRKSDLG